jgi:hypothetical protein
MLMELRDRIAQEADLVEEMAQFQSEGLVGLRTRFVHSDFSDLVARKRETMERLAQGREAMRPLTAAWIKARSEEGLADPGMESELALLKNAFDTVRQVEDELEAMATAYLARTAEAPGHLDDRIRLHRSWT